MDNRNRIIEGASQLFKIYGIRAVTMDSLANHLGMSKRTIYEVFSNKDEVLMGVLEFMAERQKELTNKILDESENSIDAIFRILEIGRDHMQEISPAFQADLRRFHIEVLMKGNSKCRMPDFRANKKIIEKGMEEKLFRREINPDIVIRCLDSLGRTIMDNDIYPFEEFTRKEVLRGVLINYLRGISTPEGIRLIEGRDMNF